MVFERVFVSENQKERDLLSVYFSALDKLPKNQVRTLVEASNAQLKSISGAEKMLSSVYGISLSAMSFFTDPTISQLTSGLPSQNVDLSAMSFPRKCGIRFNPDFMNKYHLVGFVAKWSAYEDINFTKRYGKEFDHQDVVSRTGWTRYYFEGKFPNDKAYIKLELYNSKTDMLNRVFYFEFTKSYRTTVDGRFYMKDRVLNEKIISDGFLIELKKYSKKDGSIVFKQANTTFEQRKFVRIMDDAEEQIIKINAIRQTMVKYTERPKMIFAITPPHLKKYARIILIMIKQMVDLNFDSSYLTKESQKPLLKTRFMLDELGNLESDGKGISGFTTLLSIGLGQSQEFHLILQTLQQLKDLYGDTSDKTIQGNAQPLYSKILTPNGWVKMGDIKVGDEVLTPFGTVTKVVGVYPKGIRKVYRLTLRDGSTTDCCNEHLWQIDNRDIVTTDELYNLVVNKGMSIKLPILEPVFFNEFDIPIDPYSFGYSLVHSYKAIPDSYKYNSIDVRLDLLRGFFDSYFGFKTYEDFNIIVSNFDLAKDIQFIIKSLGGSCYLKNTVSGAMIFDIYCPILGLGKYLDFNTIKSIDFVGYDEVQCIKVEDKRHLYITDDFIPTHNTSNIIYIKSSDDSLIDTFVKMTGVTHRVYGSSKTVTRDLEKLWMKNKGEVSLSYSAVEEPVISYNDFYFIAERNSIVLRAGDPPVWNRNETILPMAWRLYKDTIKLPGKEFTLSTIPSLSNITDFDIRKNQPDFGKMFTKKLEQAAEVERAVDRYAEVYGYSDYDIAQLDPDLYADDIMDIIRDCMEAKNEDFSDDFRPYDPEFDEKPSVSFDRSKLVNNNRTSNYSLASGSTSNEEFKKAYIENEKNEKIKNAKIYAGGLVSRSDLYDPHGGGCLGTYDECIIASYVSCMTDFSNSVDFEVENGTRILRLRKNGEILINVEGMTQAAIDKINKEIGDPNSRSFGNKKLTLDDATKYKVTPAFIEYLISLDSWKGIAGGSFEDKMRESVANFINESNGEKRDKNY